MKKYLTGSLLLAAILGFSAYAAKDIVKPMPVVATRTMQMTFNGGPGSNCTSSPCTITSQNGFVDEVVRNSTGDYFATFITGNFSAPPSCTCSANEVSVGAPLICGVLGASTGGLNIRIFDHAGTLTDAQVEVLCAGI